MVNSWLCSTLTRKIVIEPYQDYTMPLKKTPLHEPLHKIKRRVKDHSTISHCYNAKNNDFHTNAIIAQK